MDGRIGRTVKGYNITEAAGIAGGFFCLHTAACSGIDWDRDPEERSFLFEQTYDEYADAASDEHAGAATSRRVG
jgi:hypothetical protein